MAGPFQRVALVTGGSSGIGRATAYAFGRQGYATVIADADEGQGRQAAAEIEAEDHESIFVRCDVSDEGDVQALFRSIEERYGRLDAAFNNAGIEGHAEATATSEASNFDRIVAVNLRGVWLCMREEIRMMLRQPKGGAIVNCSSVAGLIGLPGMSAYVASKHGVIGLTKTAALEYAQQQIRVNAVCPGAIETPMLERYMQSVEGGRDAMIQTEPMRRIGRPSEIASAVLWLCCGESSFTTGQALAVDGGWTVG